MRLMLWLGLAVLLFAGCTELLPFSSDSGGVSGDRSLLPGAPTAASEPYGYADETYAIDYETAYDTSSTSKLQTKEASVGVEVERGELEDKLREAQTLLAAHDANIVSVFYNEYGGWKAYSLAFKIAPAEFDEMLEELKQLGDVQYINVDIEDVTKQHTDLNIRLANKQRELGRLYEFYDRSETVEELLAVEREITRVTTEIEQLQGQLESLESRIEKSTITLELAEPLADSEAVEGQITLSFSEGQLEQKLQALRGVADEKEAEITSLRFTQTAAESRYVIVVRMDAAQLETFMEEVRALGTVQAIETTVDEQNRPEKSLVYVTLIGEKSPVETDLFAPLETVFSTFLGALSFGVVILAGFVGFLLPLGILLWILLAIYRKIRGRSRMGR